MTDETEEGRVSPEAMRSVMERICTYKCGECDYLDRQPYQRHQEHWEKHRAAAEASATAEGGAASIEPSAPGAHLREMGNMMSDTTPTADSIATEAEEQIVSDLGLAGVPEGAHDEDVAYVQEDLDNGATPEEAKADLVNGVETEVMVDALLGEGGDGDE